ncbi:MAG: hypothetical protein COB67_09515 [SAR324 cluster bacterium]|uniref:Undecaprenyl-diphosphatase n=1 Tax=SAR324 cluster bacterium TaxID=2024889 RepID=A0A2A4T0Y7_9DELT|nr:MAG: hypothetical protein COB67_09515 [SAR324 cluster bacterium]
MIDIYFKAVLLAILEGITEFIPVSSTGHMILVGDLISFTGQKAASFEVFIQLGAILAVVVIYKEKFWGLLPKQDGKFSFKNVLFGKSSPTGLHLLVAIVPILILGFLLHKIIKTHLFSPLTVAIGLIVGGLLMIIIERLPLKKEVAEVEDITLKQAFLIGLGQCLAIWPGMSRSGSTMLTSLLVGVQHKPAADFSFIIAVPVMCAAVGYDLLKSWHFLEFSDLPYFALGFVIAFVVAWLSIKWFLKILVKVQLTPFGYYRILIGSLTLWMTTGT